MIDYILPFVLAFILSILFTFAIKFFAKKYQILDRPEKNPDRKIHKKAIPLLGGLAIFLSFNITVLFSLQNLTGGYMLPKYLWGIFIGGLVLMILGFLDDKFDLKPKHQVFFPPQPPPGVPKSIFCPVLW